MKRVLATIILLSTVASAGSLLVTITNIAPKGGKIYVGLYTKEYVFANFIKAFRKIVINAGDKVATLTFNNIPDGVYAISLFHDENLNGIFDKNFLGIPKEGYAFSNNVRPALRAAKFSEANFTLKGDQKITIKMGY